MRARMSAAFCLLPSALCLPITFLPPDRSSLHTEETIMRGLTLLVALAAGTLATAALADQEVTHSFDSSTPLRGVRRGGLDNPARGVRFRDGRGHALGPHGGGRAAV